MAHRVISFPRSDLAAFGASCPFLLMLANVPSPNPQQPFAADDTPALQPRQSARRSYALPASTARGNNRAPPDPHA